MKKKKRYSILILTVFLAVKWPGPDRTLSVDRRITGREAVLQKSDWEVRTAGGRQRLQKADQISIVQRVLHRKTAGENIPNRAVSSVLKLPDESGESSSVWENAGAKSRKCFCGRKSKRGPP